jgi:hypothetical protein
MAALPTCTIFESAMFGNQADALGGVDLQVPPEAAGEVEDVDVVEAMP